jgi:hypothetical protein
MRLALFGKYTGKRSLYYTCRATFSVRSCTTRIIVVQTSAHTQNYDIFIRKGRIHDP